MFYYIIVKRKPPSSRVEKDNMKLLELVGGSVSQSKL